MPREHYLFITGTLAESALRKIVEPLAAAAGFQYSVQVMPITVAAMITPKWAARRIRVPREATRIMVPGYCLGDLAPLEEATGRPVQRGPKDLEQLPDHFGHRPDMSDYGAYDVQIVAQVRNAPRLALPELATVASRFNDQGADLIALCCPAGETWTEADLAVRALREEGRRVAIDSRNTAEIEAAVQAGAELVFSVDSRSCREAAGWGCEVVVIPDAPGTLSGLDETVGTLTEAGVALRVNPGLAPLGFGLAESIGRHLAIRWQWPQVEMLMDVGSLTEMTEVDSAGINALLLGLCQELRIQSVATNQDASWARSSVRECDLARQMLHYAAKHHVLARNLDSRLLLLRDRKVFQRGIEEMLDLADRLKDPSYRILAENGRLHVISAGLYLDGTDPYDVFDQLLARSTRPLGPAYAFYLGYEMAKAVTALTLGKNYRQDDALEWGFLTVPELTRRQRRAQRVANRVAQKQPDSEPPATDTE